METVASLPPPENEIDPHQKIPESEINHRFKEMANSGQGFKFRTSQVEYAHHVTRVLNDSAILCVEGGTGTGKTQGYLVPVMEFLRRNTGSRVAISTYTKSLQNQIFQREIGFTQNIFKMYKDIPVALLKGKSNYICAEQLDTNYDDTYKGEKLLAWLYLLNNVYNYEHADLESIGDNVWKYLNKQSFLAYTVKTATAKEWCGSKHVRCPAQVVADKARNSRLIVTNHHKLAFLDREQILSGLFRNYIIDEANHFEAAVRGAFRAEFNSREMYQLLRYMKKTIREIHSKTAGVTKDDTENILDKLAALKEYLEELKDALTAINPSLKFMEESVLIPNHVMFQGGHINLHLQEMREAISSIYSSVNSILDDNSRTKLKINSRTTRKLQGELNLLTGFSGALKQIEDSLDSQNSVPSYTLVGRNFMLSSASIKVDEIIRERIYEDKDSIVYTAATLCRHESFNCFHEITGLAESQAAEDEIKPGKRVESVALPSPFSPDLMEVIVPEDAVSGRYSNKGAWLSTIVPMIVDLVKGNKGRTLVLFSSYGDLKHVAEKISEDITNSGYPLLIQKSGSATINLCDEFRTVKESVLFGVDTFWYGVDFKGDTLTQVIITRIPNPSPRDPIQMARKKTFPAREFWEQFYYQRDIKLKQGIGRLIRSDTDKGKVVILDSRFSFKQLGIKKSPSV